MSRLHRLVSNLPFASLWGRRLAARPTRSISISRDFSRSPAGQLRSDGPFSAQAFRDDLLIPALAAGDHINLSLDGCLGFSVAFIEATFKGLAARLNLSPLELMSRLTVQSELQTYRHFVERAIFA